MIMPLRVRTFATELWVGVSIFLAVMVSANDALPAFTESPEVSPAPAERLAQRDELRTQRRGGWLRGRGWRGSLENQKNHTEVKAAYKPSAELASKATARILADDKAVALATVVDENGYLVTKASLLGKDKKLRCQFGEREPVDATLVGVSDDYDLALLKIDGLTLTPGAWRAEAAGPGTLVAAVDHKGDVISMGVISTEPRRIQGTRNPRRAWLGVSLGGGQAGTGITQVLESSAAKRAGLNVGDWIKSIDSIEMKSMEEVISTIGNHSPGDKITILVKRSEEVLEISATLGRPADDEAPQDKWGGGPFSGRREDFPEVITHDTIIRPEQCGGPLVDAAGKIVGVNIARALRVTSYAVPAETVQRLVKELKKS